jgi:diadenosine tetraphosphate (Ap4A) HIT family hydrolase
MSGAMECPFCLPADAEVLEQTADARLLIDLRPLCVGHVLVVPRVHVSSVAESELSVREGTLGLAREAARLLRDTFGEAGIYEHGGSPICRPRSCQGGPTHAHLHVLPVAEDVLLNHQPDEPTGLRGPAHYLYQEIDDVAPSASQPLGPTVPRHLVRGRLQQTMAERGMRWLPTGADRRLHLTAIEETMRLFRIRDRTFEGARPSIDRSLVQF